MPVLLRPLTIAVVLPLVALTGPPAVAAPPTAHASPAQASGARGVDGAVHAATAPSPVRASGTWAWPGGEERIVREFVAPEHEYGPGHRGVDLAVSGDEIVSPDAGVVAFVGVVAGRPLITIDHGGGLVSTLEPVASGLSSGDAVAHGQVVGALAEGGHAPAGAVHLGARRDGRYIDPSALLGAAERPVLLPCCG
ncbi:peptidoglycan DD-metalloendopeptidase family protein [Microbacterium sp. gxy059]|uniref:peptidoglycan DD-metalloendopeptidase family protein n=1 Tax=Microbacterium sp. gxy059 TaxID=2957199 RepID=UPI003D96B14A